MANRLSGQEESGTFSHGGSIPQMGIVNPQSPVSLPYNNTSLTTAGVQYHAEIAERGIKSLDDLQSGFIAQYVVNTSIAAKGQAYAAGQQYLADHPDGEGYTDFVVSTFKAHMQQGIDGAPSPEAKRALDNHSKTASLELFESSYNTELRTGAQWQLGQTSETIDKLCNQVLINPSTYLSNKALLEQAILPMQKYNRVLNGGYTNYRRSVMDKYDTSAANGLISADPYMALNKLQSESHLTGLSPESRRSLIAHAQAGIRARQQEAINAQKMELTRQHKEDQALYAKAGLLLANDMLSWDEAANWEFNDPMIKAQLLTDIVKHEKAKEKQIDRQLQLDSAIKNGESLVGFSKNEINQSFVEHLSQMSIQTDPVTGQQREIGLIDEAMLAVDNYKTSQPIDTLTAHIINTMEHGTPEDVREAVSAIQILQKGNNNFLKNVPQKYIAMADYVAVQIPPSVNIKNSTNFNAKEVERARQIYLYSGRTAEQDKDIDRVSAQQWADMNSMDPQKVARAGVDFTEIKDFINTGGLKFSTPWIGQDKLSDKNGVPYYLKPQLYEDTKRFFYEAGRLNITASVEEKINYATKKNQEIYGRSKYCDNRVTRYPLEKLYPHLQTTPTIGNMIAMRTYQCVVDNIAINGNHSQVRFVNNNPATLIKTTDFADFSRNYHKKDYTVNKMPEIEVRVNGKWNKVKIMARTEDPYQKTVRLFYQIEDGNMMSEVPLTMPSVNPYGLPAPLMTEDEE